MSYFRLCRFTNEVVMLFSDFLRDVYLPNHDYGVADSTAAQLRSAIGTLERIVGRKIHVEELSTQLINNALDWIRANRRPDTFRTTRGSLLTLWRAAIHTGHNQNTIQNIRKFRAPKRKPVAFTPSEILSILETACPPNTDNAILEFKRLPGIDIPEAYWFDSIIRTAYDTALRLGDLLSLKPSQIEFGKDGGEVTLLVSKTQEDVTRWLSPATCHSIQRVLRFESRRELVWPLWGLRCAFYRRFRSIVKRSGVRAGTFRYIRRCAVTWAEIQHEGQGSTLAGHANRRVTLESYRDVSQIDTSRIAPPRIEIAATEWEKRRKS